ncbi:MAG: D-lyxose/D-mannose family sugar isomerase [Oscillospiraceae bacterium]|nr:D-lyxose/D-mannose family sugar isomerase [Oscillospiraceae bacterium]
MRRSEINKALSEMERMCREHGVSLPPFCGFTPEQWRALGSEYDEVRDCMLGWDITDYGRGDFDRIGFSLITIRNGNRSMPGRYPKAYAEKLLFLKEGQYAPNHFHWYKAEDIINRGGGGNVLIKVYRSLPDEQLDLKSEVTAHCDGREFTVPAGTQIRLRPGESIYIPPLLYHDFSVEEGGGAVLLGEVSQCNDDNTDNRFNPPVGRFSEIEEDEPPYRLLCNEYPPAARGGR